MKTLKWIVAVLVLGLTMGVASARDWDNDDGPSRNCAPYYGGYYVNPYYGYGNYSTPRFYGFGGRDRDDWGRDRGRWDRDRDRGGHDRDRRDFRGGRDNFRFRF